MIVSIDMMPSDETLFRINYDEVGKPLETYTGNLLFCDGAIFHDVNDSYLVQDDIFILDCVIVPTPDYIDNLIFSQICKHCNVSLKHFKNKKTAINISPPMTHYVCVRVRIANYLPAKGTVYFTSIYYVVWFTF